MKRQEWMLKPWECHKVCEKCADCVTICDVGIAAQRKLLKWLDESCKEHYGITHVRHNHIDCPKCMAELREKPND